MFALASSTRKNEPIFQLLEKSRPEKPRLIPMKNGHSIAASQSPCCAWTSGIHQLRKPNFMDDIRVPVPPGSTRFLDLLRVDMRARGYALTD